MKNDAEHGVNIFSLQCWKCDFTYCLFLSYNVDNVILPKILHVLYNLELPYGDQGLFMSRNTYNVVDGYPETFLMEDYILVSLMKYSSSFWLIFKNNSWHSWFWNIELTVYRYLPLMSLNCSMVVDTLTWSGFFFVL